MLRLLSGLILLHVVALHSSIAGMELLSWSMVFLVVFYKLRNDLSFKWPQLIPLVGLLASVAISLIINPSIKPILPQLAFMRWIILLWAFYWVFELVWNDAFEQKLIRTWVGALSITAVYAFIQFLFGVNWFHPSSLMTQMNGVYRATGFFSMTLTFAYVFGVSFFSILLPSFKQGRMWFLLALAFGILGEVSSMSRGAWIGMVGAGFVAVLLLARRYLPYFIGVVGLGLFLFIQADPRIAEIFHMRLEQNAATRLNLWRAYGQMFLEHPLTGVGLFQGDKLLPEYFAKLGIKESFTSHAHNVLMQWAAGTGLLGLGFYFFISGWFLFAAWRLRETSQWGWSLFIAQIFWHLGGLTEANFFDGEVNHIIVFTWAIILFLQSRSTKIVET